MTPCIEAAASQHLGNLNYFDIKVGRSVLASSFPGLFSKLVPSLRSLIKRDWFLPISSVLKFIPMVCYSLFPQRGNHVNHGRKLIDKYGTPWHNAPDWRGRKAFSKVWSAALERIFFTFCLSASFNLMFCSNNN